MELHKTASSPATWERSTSAKEPYIYISKSRAQKEPCVVAKRHYLFPKSPKRVLCLHKTCLSPKERLLSPKSALYAASLLASSPSPTYECTLLQCIGMCCNWSVVQCVAVCCSVLQWVAVGCSQLALPRLPHRHMVRHISHVTNGWLRLVSRMNESCHTYDTRESQICQRVTSHMLVSMSRGTHANESRAMPCMNESYRIDSTNTIPCPSWVVLQCDAVCCSVLQCFSAWCSVVQCVEVCCSMLQRVAACCSSHPSLGSEPTYLRFSTRPRIIGRTDSGRR